jgi:hypothetical protein
MRSERVRIKPLIWPLAVLFLIASLCPFTSSGQTDAASQVIAVSGSASTASGAAVGGALVQVISDAGVLVESVTTQKDGSYTLHLAPGIYIVRGSVEGKVIGDEQLVITGAGAPTSRLIEGKFFQGSRDTSTRSGPAVTDPKGQIVRIFMRQIASRRPHPLRTVVPTRPRGIQVAPCLMAVRW